MTTTVVRAAGTADLLSYVEHSLGFRPRESLVLVSLRPPRQRVGLLVRVDLADLDETRARLLAVRVRADGATGAVVLVLSEGPPPAQSASGAAVLDRLPVAAAVRALLGALRAEGVARPEASLVRGGRTWSYTCAQECCPGRGRRLDDPSSTRTAAEMVLAGSAVARDRAAWTRQETAALAPASAAVRRVTESAARRAGADHRDVLAWWRSVLTDASTAVAAGRPAGDVAEELVSPASAGRMLRALADTSLRDAVLLTLVPGGDAAADLVAADAPGAAQLLGAVLDAEDDGRDDGGDDDGRDDGGDDDGRNGHLRSSAGPVVDDEAADSLLRLVVRCAGPSRRAEPLAVLAWCSWWRGSGARAVLFAELALRSPPRPQARGARADRRVCRGAGAATPDRSQGPARCTQRVRKRSDLGTVRPHGETSWRVRREHPYPGCRS